MTATTLMRRMLLGEALFYAVVALLLHGAGWDCIGIAAALVALALCGRGLMVCNTYLVAHLFRTPLPAGQAISPLRFLRMAATEYAAFVVLFTFVQPFERLFMSADRLARSAAGKLPVLLVHGYQCNRGTWLWQRARLERAGWTVATLNLNPVFASIDNYGEQIAQRIEEVCAATGAAQVVLVGISMGGLAARACLRSHGTVRVAKLVTLGSPHHGSRLAKFGAGINARQMEPDSAWLATLEREAPLPACAVSARSLFDNYVMPQDSPLLAGSRDVLLGPVGHLTMAFSSAVTRLLLAELSD
jgi:triacylglycerol lipase